MYALNPSATGPNAAAATPPDSGIDEPMLTVPSIGALTRSGSMQSSVATVQASPPPPPSVVSPPSVSPVVVSAAVSSGGSVASVSPAVVGAAPPPVPSGVVAAAASVVSTSSPSSGPRLQAARSSEVAASAARRRDGRGVMDFPFGVECGRVEDASNRRSGDRGLLEGFDRRRRRPCRARDDEDELGGDPLEQADDAERGDEHDDQQHDGEDEGRR